MRLDDDEWSGRATPAQVRGHVLEAVLPSLLGHRLKHLSPDSSPPGVRSTASTIFVRGRGADHQADVLAELTDPLPFGPRLRILMEAKFWTRTIGLPELRNAAAVLTDVNQVRRVTGPPGDRSLEPGDAADYRYVVLSASGFSEGAVGFAYAHQISLLDLSAAPFTILRRIVSHTTVEVMAANGFGPFPVSELHAAFRRARAHDTHLMAQVSGPFDEIARRVVALFGAVTNPADAEPHVGQRRSRSTPSSERDLLADYIGEDLGESLPRSSKVPISDVALAGEQQGERQADWFSDEVLDQFMHEVIGEIRTSFSDASADRAESVIALAAQRGGALPTSVARAILGDFPPVRLVAAARAAEGRLPDARVARQPKLIREVRRAQSLLVLRDDLTDFLAS